jgi:hypothetical protein
LKTHPIYRKDGTLLAFEVTSLWMSFRPLYRILLSIPGVDAVRRQYRKDDRLAFNFHGQPYVVNEPFGDSSRYWVGPVEPATSTLDAIALESAFKRYRGLLGVFLRG